MNKPHFIQGAMYCLDGFKDLKQKGIKRYVILPLLINIIIFGALFYFGLTTIWHKINAIGTDLPTWLQWMSGFVSFLKWVVKIVLSVISIGAFAIISTLGANLLASPFNGFLSERFSRNLKADLPPSPSIMQIIKRELRKLLYYLPRAIMVGIMALIFYFIPPLNLLIPVILYWFGAWMMAIQYIDYPADNFHVSFADLIKLLKANRGLTLSFGLTVAFLSSIPVLNFFVMPAAVLGATQLWHDHLRNRA